MNPNSTDGKQRFKRFGDYSIDVSQIQAVIDERETQKTQFPTGVWFITIYFTGGGTITINSDEDKSLDPFLAWLKDNTEES